MKFSILHLSDLHRDPVDGVENPALLESLTQDARRFRHETPEISQPVLCVVSGDLVHGVSPYLVDAEQMLRRQFDQAEEFLAGLADELFGGDRSRVIVLPGNHDVEYREVLASAEKIEVPADAASRNALVEEWQLPQSSLRWSWKEFCFYRVINRETYNARLRQFAQMHARFYGGSPYFSLSPEQQFIVRDFPDYGLTVVTLSSCHGNDPLQRAGAFHPTAVSEACRAIRHPSRAGWLAVAAWHHDLFGGPSRDDYMDAQVLQLFINAGVSIGLHGHQHLADCVEERYRVGPSGRKITLISAGTLCAGPRHLHPGVPRSYNVVEIDTLSLKARVHQRRMVNQLDNLPIWGPGSFTVTGASYLDVQLCGPMEQRADGLDQRLAIERGAELLGRRKWRDSVEVLAPLRDVPIARTLLARALIEVEEPDLVLGLLWPPRSESEAVVVGGAILEGDDRVRGGAFLALGIVASAVDASLIDVVRRIRERLAR